MEEQLAKLNNVQRDIVLATEGPIMVMAGAGSGKTRVLTHRIAYIINELNVPNYNILAVTFTNKSAREMKERVSKLINQNTNNMWVSTFHSFCARLLRLEMNALPPFNNRFIIIDEDDSLKIIKECLKEINSDLKPQVLKRFISKEKNLEDYDFDFEKQREIFNRVYEKYQSKLEKENLLDFDDLIIKTIELLEKNPEVLKKYQQKFKYIMVDEFQDTNVVQYKLMNMLAQVHKNIFVVGDQDQSIYSFRGAKVENINLFRKDFKDTKLILLEQNYRSTSQILNLANKVIDNNKSRIKKNLFTEKNTDEKAYYYNADTSYDEALFVVDKIKELRASGFEYSDFAIIYRQNSLSRNFEDTFIRYQIPYVIYGGISYFSRKEIKDVLSYLRLVLNNDDDFSFKRIVNEPKRKIGNSLIEKLSACALERNISLFAAIDFISQAGIGYSNLIDFKFKILEIKEEIEKTNMPNIIDLIINKTGYLEMLKAEGIDGEARIENVEELRSVLKEADEFYEGSKIEKLEALLSDLALRTDTDSIRDTDDVVKLMTFHQAKGLEFKVVFLVAMEAEIFPSKNAITDFEIEEERRICYVGITRAEEKLYITNAKSRYLYGNQLYSRPSIFVSEMGNSSLNNLSRNYQDFGSSEIKKSSFAKIEEKKVEVIEFKVGDKISHKAFGDGLIVKVDGEVIDVAFKAPHGIKKLISSHPTIKKI